MLSSSLLPCAPAACASVKFLSRLLTALNLLPSMATIASREQIELAAQHDELAADVADGSAVVPAEVGDGLEVRRQAPGQPHQLDVALRLALQPAAGLDAVEIAVDVDLQQHRRVVRRSPRRRGIDAFEAQLGQIELVDEDLDHPDRIVFGDVVVQALGQQSDLRSILAFDESLHALVPMTRCAQYRQRSAFPHNLDPLLSVASLQPMAAMQRLLSINFRRQNVRSGLDTGLRHFAREIETTSPVTSRSPSIMDHDLQATAIDRRQLELPTQSRPSRSTRADCRRHQAVSICVPLSRMPATTRPAVDAKSK